MPKFLKKHYHWIIAVTLFLLTCIRGGVANNLSALHLIPVSGALGISRAQFSLAISASSLVGMLSTMISDAAAQRISSRILLAGSLLMTGVAYLMMSQVESYAVFFTGCVLIGISVGFCGEVTNTRILSAWFHKHRGTVLGLVSSATAFGGSMVCILQTAAIERSGYKASFFLAAAMLIVGGIVAVLLVRTHPAKMGRHPYGDGEKLAYKKREHNDHWHGFSMKRLVRRPTFYMMIFGTLISNILPYLAFYVVVPHLQDMGLTSVQASSMQSILMLSLAGTKILAGYLCDKIGARKVMLICIGADAIALLLLTLVKGYGMALVTIIIFSMALPVMTILVPLLASSLFGYQAQNQYNGLFLSMVSAAGIVASPISNSVFDRIGTYCPVFWVASALSVVLMGFYLLLFRMADKDRKKLEAEESAVQG